MLERTVARVGNLELSEGVELTLDELIQFLENKVARYKLPEHLVFRSSFPRTSTGKVKRPVLVEEILLGEARP